MNSSIAHLAGIADKQEKLIIGLMSGTSLDGLDIALCRIFGHGRRTEVELVEFKTVAYPDDVVKELKQIVSVEDVKLQELCLMHTWLGEYHADLILDALRDWEIEVTEIDCIASHGQTVYHAPIKHHERSKFPNTTLQLVDADHITRKTGIVTISDFRQKHTAAGGEGAPMVALTDGLLYSHATESRLLLNIGGIANFTYLPTRGQDEDVVTTDVGPGNTLINQAMQEFFDQPFDEDGAVARKGNVNTEMLQSLMDAPFFSLSLPRTTGPELFNLEWVRRQVSEFSSINDEDIIATLTLFTAQTIANAAQEVCEEANTKIFVSGGGMHNNQLMEWLERLLKKPVHSFAEIGFDPDAKEAACFAVLANEMLSGEAFTLQPKQNAGRRVNFGKISLPI